MLRSIDLKLRERLKDRRFRQGWFRAQLEATVPAMFRKLREERRLTQNDLAAAADMKQSAISRFEKSTEATWKLETLLKLAEALDSQLVISLVKAEDVIAAYERKETGGPPRGSVLSAASAAAKLWARPRTPGEQDQPTIYAMYTARPSPSAIQHLQKENPARAGYNIYVAAWLDVAFAATAPVGVLDADCQSKSR